MISEKSYVLIEEITSEDLIKKIAIEVFKLIEADREKIAKLPPVDKDVYISRFEVAQMFHVSLLTIHSWMKEGILKYHKIVHKTRLLSSDVKAATVIIDNRRK